MKAWMSLSIFLTVVLAFFACRTHRGSGQPAQLSTIQTQIKDTDIPQRILERSDLKFVLQCYSTSQIADKKLSQPLFSLEGEQKRAEGGLYLVFADEKIRPNLGCTLDVFAMQPETIPATWLGKLKKEDPQTQPGYLYASEVSFFKLLESQQASYFLAGVFKLRPLFKFRDTKYQSVVLQSGEALDKKTLSCIHAPTKTTHHAEIEADGGVFVASLPESMQEAFCFVEDEQLLLGSELNLARQKTLRLNSLAGNPRQLTSKLNCSNKERIWDGSCALEVDYINPQFVPFSVYAKAKSGDEDLLLSYQVPLEKARKDKPKSGSLRHKIDLDLYISPDVTKLSMDQNKPYGEILNTLRGDLLYDKKSQDSFCPSSILLKDSGHFFDFGGEFNHFEIDKVFTFGPKAVSLKELNQEKWSNWFLELKADSGTWIVMPADKDLFDVYEPTRSENRREFVEIFDLFLNPEQFHFFEASSADCQDDFMEAMFYPDQREYFKNRCEKKDVKPIRNLSELKVYQVGLHAL